TCFHLSNSHFLRDFWSFLVILFLPSLVQLIALQYECQKRFKFYLYVPENRAMYLRFFEKICHSSAISCPHHATPNLPFKMAKLSSLSKGRKYYSTFLSPCLLLFFPKVSIFSEQPDYAFEMVCSTIRF